MCSLLLIMSVAGRSTPGWFLCKTLNISSASEVTREECGWPLVI